MLSIYLSIYLYICIYVCVHLSIEKESKRDCFCIETHMHNIQNKIMNAFIPQVDHPMNSDMAMWAHPIGTCLLS